MLNDIPFEFKRLQFRLKVFLGDEDYKSQWQTLKIAGIELRQDCFPHGQFYMACLDCKLTPKPGYFATILQNG